MTRRLFRRATALGLVLVLALASAVAAAGAAPAPLAAATRAAPQLPKMTTEPQGKRDGAASHSASAAAPAPTHEVLQLGKKHKWLG